MASESGGVYSKWWSARSYEIEGCMPLRGKLIVIEGPDGVGKSTVAESLAARLRARGVDVRGLSFPKGASGSLGQVVYEIHHEPERFGIEGIDRTSRQVLHVAAHIDTIENAIRPHVRGGGWVVLDRSWWSTWVYGMAYGVPEASVRAMIDLERVHWADLRPDLVLLIDRERPFRAETDEAGYRRLRGLYQELESRESAEVPIRRLSNDGTLTETVEECMESLSSLLGEPGAAEATEAEGTR